MVKRYYLQISSYNKNTIQKIKDKLESDFILDFESFKVSHIEEIDYKIKKTKEL